MIHSELIKKMENISVVAKETLHKNGKQQEIKDIEKYLTDIKKRETNIMVCGEFKRGKSSFINAFLEQDLCPVDVGEATAAISIIRYGDKQKITRYYGDLTNQQEEILANLSDIERFVKGSVDSIDNTFLITIEIPNEKLKNGIAIIDSPGIGGTDPRHAFLTNYFLPKADVVLFVIDSGEPMTQSEIDFYKNKVKSVSKQSAILLNKSDLFRDEQSCKERVTDVKTKVNDANVDVIPISSKRMQIYLNDKNKIDSYEKSNFKSIDLLIERLTESFKKDLLVQLRDYICNCLLSIYEPLKVQLEQIKIPDPNFLNNRIAQRSKIDQEIKNFDDPNSEFRKNLNRLIAEAKNTVDNTLSNEWVILSSQKVNELIKDPRASSDNWLLSQINNGVSGLASELDALIDAAFAQVMICLGENYELSHSASSFTYRIDADLRQPDKSLGEMAHSLGKNTLPGMGVFFLVSSIAATVATAGAAWPLLVGGASAVGFVGKNIVDTKKQGNSAFLKEKLQPQIHIAQNNLRQYINKRFTDFSTILLEIFKKNKERKSVELNVIISEVAKLDANRKNNEQRAKQLQEEIKIIEQQINTTKLFLSNPFSKNASSNIINVAVNAEIK